jgi:hypothetical protein
MSFIQALVNLRTQYCQMAQHAGPNRRAVFSDSAGKNDGIDRR